jgi:Ca-activated chloride channel family protein
MTQYSKFRPQLVGFMLGAALTLMLAACNTEHPVPPQKNSGPVDEKVIATGRGDKAEADVMTRSFGGLAMSSPMRAMMPAPAPGYWQPANTSKFPDAKANAVIVAAEQPVSTFSIDVDTASYGVVRDALNGGALPPADAVRIEEMVNYFDYAYPLPENRAAPFRASVRVYPTPWNKDTQILHIGIKGFDIPKK